MTGSVVEFSHIEIRRRTKLTKNKCNAVLQIGSVRDYLTGVDDGKCTLHCIWATCTSWC